MISTEELVSSALSWAFHGGVVEPLEPWWGPVDAHWHQPAAGTPASMYGTSHKAPRLYTNDGEQGLHFVLHCPGEQCDGTLVEMYGTFGNFKAKQVPCPAHRGRLPQLPLDETELLGDLQRKRRQTLQEAEIPVFYTSFTLENWPGDDRAALEACEAYTRKADDTQGLVLFGPFGTGKTSLAKAILEARIRRYGQSGLFVSTADMLQRLKPGFDMDERLLGRLKHVQLLVLDDLGAGRSETAFGNDIVWQVISYRHDHALPTICTSNHPSVAVWQKLGLHRRATDSTSDWGETLEDAVGERTVQRLLDAYHLIVVRGRNLRGENT